MAAKVEKVFLVNDNLNANVEYDIKHAERLLRMLNNGGWHLPKDSEYKFDFDNGIERKRNKKTDNRTEEKSSN